MGQGSRRAPLLQTPQQRTDLFTRQIGLETKMGPPQRSTPAASSAVVGDQTCDTQLVAVAFVDLSRACGWLENRESSALPAATILGGSDGSAGAILTRRPSGSCRRKYPFPDATMIGPVGPGSRNQSSRSVISSLGPEAGPGQCECGQNITYFHWFVLSKGMVRPWREGTGPFPIRVGQMGRRLHARSQTGQAITAAGLVAGCGGYLG